MAEKTEISWTDATFNPWIGCTKISPGCDNCYAAQQDGFRKWTPEGWGAGKPRKLTKTWGHPVKWNAEPFYECLACGNRFTFNKQGEVTCAECGGDRVKEARKRVFCASLADVFDNEVDPAWRVDLFALIAATPNLDWLLLTKRIGNVANMLGDYRTVPLLPNIWLGATIVNQEEADRDIPKLLATPARVRFLSMEPLLGPVRLEALHIGKDSAMHKVNLVHRDDDHIDSLHPTWRKIGHGIDWVIVGGESGPNARPMHPDWARSLRDQCAAAGVPLHFKQWGEWIGAGQEYPGRDGGKFAPIREFGYDEENRHRLHRIGKKAAGRLLDGVEHNGFPEA